MMKFSNKMGFSKMTVYNTVSDVLNNVPYTSIFSLYYDKVIVGEYKIFGMNVIRIWQNNKFFGIDKSFTGGDRLIGAMDYSVSPSKFKIEYLYVIDSDSGRYEADPKYVNAKEYMKLMISIAERKAKAMGLDITMDTHQSLRLFHRYYDEEGFLLTGKVASDHSAWVEMKKEITKNQEKVES